MLCCCCQPPTYRRGCYFTKLQALQTLMARQRVAYDFEYFRCG